MLCTTVFTSCRFAVVLLFFAALPAHASRFGSSGAIGRAASKPVGALSSINKGGLHLRQQAYAPGDPQYLADVVGRVCNTVSPDLLNICVTDVTAAIQNSTVSYCAFAQNELTICLVDQPQNCTDSQVSFDGCANFTIATYDYCIGMGYTTLPGLPDCANSELQGTPVIPYGGSAATTTTNSYGYTDTAAATSTTDWYGYTDTAAATSTTDSYGYTDTAVATTDSYGYGYTDSSTPATTTTSTPSVVIITTSTPIAVPTTQMITYVTVIGTTTILVTTTSVVPTTIFSLQTLTSATPTTVQVTSTMLSTYATTYTTTTIVSGSAVPTTLTSSVVSTIYSCAGGCTHPTSSLRPDGLLCVRRSSVRLVQTSTRASTA